MYVTTKNSYTGLSK